MTASWEADADRLHASGTRHALILSKSRGLGQIAGGLAQALAPRQLHITSACTAGGKADPLAQKVLAELSVQVAEEHVRTLADVDTSDVQAILVVSEEDPTPAALQGVLKVQWAFPDPAAAATEEEKLARYRAVRNELRRRLIRVFARDATAKPVEALTSSSIAPASGGDVDDLKPLLAASLLPTSDVVGMPHQRFILVRQEGRVLACAGLQVAGQDGLVRSMAVHWTRRNAGLGTRLHQRLLFDAVLAGVKTLWVVTATAEDFFARQGYRRVTAAEVPAGLRTSAEFTAFAPGGGTVMRRAVMP